MKQKSKHSQNTTERTNFCVILLPLGMGNRFKCGLCTWANTALEKSIFFFSQQLSIGDCFRIRGWGLCPLPLLVLEPHLA